MGRLDEKNMKMITSDFEAKYEELYGKGAGFGEAQIECLTYRVFGIGKLPFKPKLSSLRKSDSPSPREALIERRMVYLDVDEGEQVSNIFDYRRLTYGHEIEGPAIIEVPTTTVVVPRSALGRIDQFGNLELTYE